MAQITGNINKLPTIFERPKNSFKKRFEKLDAEKQTDLKIIGLTFLLSFMFYLELEICDKNYTLNGFVFTFVNIFMVYSFIALLGIFTVKRWISALITGITATGIGILNFYVIEFRTQPISTMDIQNMKTAANVASSYNYRLRLVVVATIMIFSASLYIVALLRKAEKNKTYNFRKYCKRIVGIFAFCSAFYYVFFFAPWSVKPKITVVWSWWESYHKYGFLACSEELFAKSFNVVSESYGYNEQELSKLEGTGSSPENEKTPDVIFILNETFFDLKNVISNLETDKDYMPFIRSLENKVYGYSIVPGCGGGTNRSEYEFLTSNSLELMQGITPFTFMDLTGANSIVSFLKAKGYETWAAHPAPSMNYTRGTAYPKLGFDTIKFIDEFDEAENYGDRDYVSDIAVYETLTKDYENMGDGPRFMYALTIQNHGSWELNEPEEDIIHVSNDFGDLTDDVNEYLSCISLSDSAFEYLVNYYKNSDRDVIICMTGDHCPSFAPDIADKAKNGFEKFKLYATPFVMWANFNLEEKDLGYTSLNYLAPLTLQNAGMGLSPYYNFMCSLFRDYPITTSNGVYGDNSYNLKSYAGPNCEKRIRTYLNLVYNNASKKANRIDSLFMP